MIATFPFAVDPAFAPIARIFGVDPAKAAVEIDETHLHVHFGIWRMAIRLEEIAGAVVSGPYQKWRVVGGPRMSLRDHGLTFATTAERGLCIEFVTPQPAPWPGGAPHAPAITVTVADPEALQEMLTLHTTQA